VTNLNDAGMGSLRQAISDTPAGGTVEFQPGLSGTITLTTGELGIAKDLTIAGPGADVITVSGNHASRVFDVAATFTVSLSGLTIADGLAITTLADGGGIRNNSGALTVTGSVLSGNTASGSKGVAFGFGGGIFNSLGTVTVTDSILSGNTATGDLAGGGGIDNFSTLTVTDSILSGNSASGGSSLGGGITNFGTLTVTDSALSGNSAGGGSTGLGGGIYNSSSSPLTVTNSTISGNSATVAGGGIYNAGLLAVRGLVTIDGDYFQTAATGTLSIRIGGLQAGSQYDQLMVNGFATLDGTLDLHLVNGYRPQPGHQFQPLLFTQGQGTFAHYTGEVSGFSFLYAYDDGGFLPPGLTLVAN
jgi:hypothetical protein